jgi:hypothetical protein
MFIKIIKSLSYKIFENIRNNKEHKFIILTIKFHISNYVLNKESVYYVKEDYFKPVY